MMKKATIILMFLAVAIAAMAQWPAPSRAVSSTQRVVGYTTSDAIDKQNVGTGYAGTHAVGALVPADMLKPYVGCKVVGLRFALGASATTSRVFVRPLDSEGILADADSVTQSVWHPHSGWNEVMFNGVKGYTIRQGEGLFFGFDVTETAEQAQTKTGILATADGSQSYGFLVLGNFGSGEGLYAINGKGLLCVQLIVDISSLPSKSMKFTHMTNGYQYKQPGDLIDFFVQYQNTGRDTIRNYTINYTLDGGQPVSLDTADVVAGGALSSIERVFNLPADIASGPHVLRVYITQADGVPMGDDTFIADTFSVYREKYARQQTYLEQYADAASPYTAGCFDAMATAVQGLKGNVAYVNIYREGNPLACDKAGSLCQDYAYTYPSFTMDRSYYPGEAHVAYDLNYYVLTAPALVAGMMQELLQDEHSNPAFAQLQIAPQYDAATRNLTLTVSGTTTSEAPAIFGDLGLTLMLTEDSVASPQAVYNAATGSTSTVRQYMHNHVLRDVLTAVRGDKLQLQGNAFTATYSNTLPAGVNPARMTAVAMVSRYVDPSGSSTVGLKHMDILNANSISLKDAVTGLAVTHVTPAGPALYYTLDGRQVTPSEATHGIYIVKQANGQYKKIMR